LPLVEVARITVARQCDPFLRWILRLAVGLAPRAQLSGQQFPIRPSGDRDRLETRLHGELYTQTAEPADAQDDARSDMAPL
jgi:hypothetical protein